MRNRSRFLAMVAVGTLVLGGCGRKEAPPAPPPTIVVPPPSPSAVSAADYFRLESSRSLLVVRAAELAMQRSGNGTVTQLATRLKADHTGIAAQLSMAGRRLNLLPSAALSTPDQARLDDLSRAAGFDAAFLRAMRSAAEECARSHGSYAANGSSPTLRPVARFAASVCRDEQAAL